MIITAVPMFIFMGMMLERSGVPRDLLNCLQVLPHRVPSGLALSVILMGTILARSFLPPVFLITRVLGSILG